MPLPNSINLPKKVVSEFQTRASQVYNANITFPIQGGSVPWNVGILLDGSTYGFINTATPPGSSGSANVPFTGNGSNLKAAFLISTTTAGSTGSYINIGWLAGENNNEVGSILLTKENGPVNPPNNSNTESISSNNQIHYPFRYRMLDWPGRGNYTGIVKLSIAVSIQDSAVVAVLDSNGSLLGTFTDKQTDPVYVSLANEVWVLAFLEFKNNGRGKFDFQVGDPRKDGSMDIEEV